MAEILTFSNFNLNTAPPKAVYSTDIKTQNGVAFYYNDFSTLGYIENNGEVTHLLVGYFVPTYGYSVKSISLKNPAEPILALDVGTYDSENPYYYGTLKKLSDEKVADAQMTFTSNYEEKDSAEALKKIEEAFKTLQSSQPANFELANKILAEVEQKYSGLFLTVPKLREQPAPSIFEEEDDEDIFLRELEENEKLYY